MGERPLHYLDIAEASGLIRRRELSPVELTRACLDRIEALDDFLHAYITVVAEPALREAKAAETAILRGDYLGPLHGIPVALKDLFATRGIRTTAGSRVLGDWVPDEDATAVARLKQAGTVLLGKLTTYEFAGAGPNFKGAFPPARNPWNIQHNAGGSSSGSAVSVAAGLCLGSLGSDTGGSIRHPATRCGIVGLKPTYGRVSRHGVVTDSWSLDHCGPMTWTVQDAALMLQAIAGHDPEDPCSSRVPVPDYSAALDKGVKGLVLGIPRSEFFDPEIVEPETLAAVEKAIKALEALGAKTRAVEMRGLEQINATLHCIQKAEIYSYHQDNVKSQPHNYGDDVLRNLRSGAIYSAVDYIQAQRARSLVKQELDQVMTQVDAIVTPTTSHPAERFDQIEAPFVGVMGLFTRPFSLAGMPAISICCGFTADGLPIGLQIAGRAFDESTVLRIAHTYERSTPWRQRRPPVEALMRQPKVPNSPGDNRPCLFPTDGHSRV